MSSVRTSINFRANAGTLAATDLLGGVAAQADDGHGVKVVAFGHGIKVILFGHGI